MKRVITFLCLLIIGIQLAAQGPQTVFRLPYNTNGDKENGILYLPDDYNSNPGKKYPLLVFLNGAGEGSTNAAELYTDTMAGGPSYFIAQGEWPSSFTNPKDGQQYKFIVLSAQYFQWGANSGKDLNTIVKYMVDTFRVDVSRIYLTGISAGGQGIIEYTGHYDVDPTYKPAAIVPMSAVVHFDRVDSYATNTAADQVYVWGFGDPDGDTHGANTRDYVNRVNAIQPGLADFYKYVGGHYFWNRYYHPDSAFSFRNSAKMNIYEWMLTQKRSIAFAGADQTIKLPVNSVTLSGSATASPGTTITSYSWSKVSGPSQFSIVNPNQASTAVNNLVEGTYVFKLTVTNSQNETGTDNVNIVVKPAPTYVSVPAKLQAESYGEMNNVRKEPTTDIGGGENVGYIGTDSWMEYYINPTVTGTYTLNFRVASQNTTGKIELRNASNTVLASVMVPNTGGWQTWQTISTTVNLEQGDQTIRLYAAVGGWNINWFEFTNGNLPPTANAGVDKSITLPTNSVQLAGSGTDPDGTITSYQWSQISGPSNATLTNAATQTVTAGNLVQGTYVFHLVVTDNANATGSDDVTVTVNANPVHTIPGKVEGENYAAMSGVQKEPTQDVGGGQNVGYIDTGDWIDYNLNAQSAGTYTVEFRVAAQFAGAKFEVKNASNVVLATVDVPQTGGWQTWQTVSYNFTLPAGSQTIRLLSTGTNGWNINWMNFQLITPSDYVSIPAKIEAEAYTAQQGTQNESTTDVGGGQNVGYIDYGDFMEYKIRVTAAGNYDLTFRVATPGDVGKFTVAVDGTVVDTVDVPNTGGFQTWQTTIPIVLNLTAGDHIVRLTSVGYSLWNINWLQFAYSAGSVNRPGSTPEAQALRSAAFVRIYPNPIKDRLMLQVSNSYNGQMRIEITDMNGAVRVRKSIMKNTAVTPQLPIPLDHLGSGQYIIRIQMNEWKETRKFIKL